MMDFIVLAAEATPELVEQLEIGTEPQADISLLIVRANAFADGDPNAAVLTISRPDVEQSVAEEQALEMDPVLYDIFSKETAGHLKVITDYLEACAGHEPPFAVTDKLHRACHTLHGSANMANVERGVAVAAALNRFVRRNYDHKIGFQQSGLDVLRAAARAINTIVGDINNPDRDRADYTSLINHIGNLSNAVQVSIAPAPEPQSVPAPKSPEPKVPAPVETPPPPAAPAPSEEAEYDVEIAAIFTEESAELLESADQALIDWVRERSAQPMDELKRHLHTLKGGARMAGITAMGRHPLSRTCCSAVSTNCTACVTSSLRAKLFTLHRNSNNAFNTPMPGSKSQTTPMSSWPRKTQASRKRLPQSSRLNPMTP
jgi:chemosensory pili system protein ChpA (sensor histidine kinase/response regulator)